MKRRGQLGRGLGRSLAWATVLGIFVFIVVVGVALFLHERYDTSVEDPPHKIVIEIAIALAAATPVAIWLALRLGGKLIRSTADRLDEVIATASQMTGMRASERLPVSAAGDDLDRLVVALNDAFDRIERGLAAQAQFVADASHELRTPLAVIATQLEVARRRDRDPGRWEQVADEVLLEVRRMQDLAEKLLLLSRAEAAPIQPAREDLRQLAAQAVVRAHALAAEHGVVVELADGPVVETVIDREAIGIVIDNLLRNAVEHSPRGEKVCLRVDPGPRIIVEDRGPGVPADQRERVFRPFARGIRGATDRARGDGVGLGLAICARITASHHGSIAVEDRPGGGARFIMMLPP